MTWVGTAVAGVSAYTSYQTGQAQKKALERQAAAEAQGRELQRLAAQFRPVGFTSPYGTARYETDEDGMLSGAYFNLSPELQERAERYAKLGEDVLGRLTIDPTVAAAERTARLEALAQPGRELARERLFSGLAAKGLTGLGVDTGMGGTANPYMLAQQLSEERTRAETAAESYDLARKQMVEDQSMAQRLFGREQDIYGIGREELRYGLELADLERRRAMESAGAQASSLSTEAGLLGRAGIQGAETTEALISSLAQTGGDIYDYYRRQPTGPYTGYQGSSYNRGLSDPAYSGGGYYYASDR